MIVPITPNKVIYPKFFTKFVFFKLYPAAKIMGGKMNTKNVDSLNWIGSIPAYELLIMVSDLLNEVLDLLGLPWV